MTPAEGERLRGYASYANVTGSKPFEARFVRPVSFRLAKSFLNQSGSPEGKAAFLSFTEAMTSSVTPQKVCVYEGERSQHFEFRYCISFQNFKALKCESDPFAPSCLESKQHLSLVPGDAFGASQLEVRLTAVIPCTTAAQVKVELKPEKSEKAYCGMVVTKKADLPDRLDCSQSAAQAALIIRADSFEFDGGDSVLLAPRAPVGVVVLGKGSKIRRLEVLGAKRGVGVLAVDSPRLSLDDLVIGEREVGIDLIQSPDMQMTPQVQLRNISGTAIRSRTQFGTN
jgi:hypothetical protein